MNLMAELNYRCYCHQRMMHPEITPERWALIFGDSVPAMEKRFVEQFVSKLFEAVSEEGFDA